MHQLQNLLPDITTITVVFLTFLLAGTVKGVIGLGLPTISIGLLTAVLDLTTAMALVIVPSFMTNVWQTFAGSNTMMLFRRLWPFLLAATAAVLIGSTALTRIDGLLLTALLGTLLAVYAASNLAGWNFVITRHNEVSAGLFMGLLNGIFTGMTGSFAVPGVMFLQGIGLRRDELVKAMGMLFTASTIALALALQHNDILTVQLGLLSVAAIIPAVIGMIIGQAVRRGISEQRFRQTFLVALLSLGVYLIAKSAMYI